MVPEGWRSLPLGDMLERITNGLVYNPRQTEGVRVTRIETISDARIDVSKVGFAEYSPAMEQYRLQRGDILYSHINSLKHIGKVAFFDSEEVLYHGMNLLLLRANNSVLPKYLYYLLDSSVGQRYAHTYAKRAVNQASINIAELRQFHFKVPPLYEQEHIIEILQTWDTSIAQTQALIAATRERKRGLMQVLLTGKKRFKEFESRPVWRVAPLGEVASTASGGTPKATEPLYYGGPFPWVTISDMTAAGKYVRSTQKSISASGLENSAAKIFPAGTVLFAMYASIGKCSIADVDLTTNQAILGIKPGSEVDGEFLYYFLSSKEVEYERMGQQGAQRNLNAGMVRSFRVPLPSLAEQKQIASVLSTADKEIDNLEQQLEAYKLQKRGLMQQLLTGKKRVKINELEAVA